MRAEEPKKRPFRVSSKPVKSFAGRYNALAGSGLQDL